MFRIDFRVIEEFVIFGFEFILKFYNRWEWLIVCGRGAIKVKEIGVVEIRFN